MCSYVDIFSLSKYLIYHPSPSSSDDEMIPSLCDEMKGGKGFDTGLPHQSFFTTNTTVMGMANRSMVGNRHAMVMLDEGKDHTLCWVAPDGVRFHITHVAHIRLTHLLFVEFSS